MNRREYNGWTNYETWLVNMWFGDVFADMQNERENTSAESLEDWVTSILEDQGQLPETGFAADIMNAAMREVDWDDLASHYEVEEEEEDESEDA
jgi:hypothetical protein